MSDELTRPVTPVGRQADRLGLVHKRSPLDDMREDDLRARDAADRMGRAYVVFRDDLRTQRIVFLERARMTVGRSDDCDVVLDWDRTVSRLHATIEHTPQAWTISDEGRSMNGTLVNGQRIRGRRPLADHDLIQVGETALGFRDPVAAAATAAAAGVQQGEIRQY